MTVTAVLNCAGVLCSSLRNGMNEVIFDMAKILMLKLQHSSSIEPTTTKLESCWGWRGSRVTTAVSFRNMQQTTEKKCDHGLALLAASGFLVNVAMHAPCVHAWNWQPRCPFANWRCPIWRLSLSLVQVAISSGVDAWFKRGSGSEKVPSVIMLVSLARPCSPSSHPQRDSQRDPSRNASVTDP